MTKLNFKNRKCFNREGYTSTSTSEQKWLNSGKDNSERWETHNKSGERMLDALNAIKSEAPAVINPVDKKSLESDPRWAKIPFAKVDIAGQEKEIARYGGEKKEIARYGGEEEGQKKKHEFLVGQMKAEQGSEASSQLTQEKGASPVEKTDLLGKLKGLGPKAQSLFSKVKAKIGETIENYKNRDTYDPNYSVNHAKKVAAQDRERDYNA